MFYKAKIQTILGCKSAPKYHIKFLDYDESMTVDRESLRAIPVKRRREPEEPAVPVTSTPQVISGPVSTLRRRRPKARLLLLTRLCRVAATSLIRRPLRRESIIGSLGAPRVSARRLPILSINHKAMACPRFRLSNPAARLQKPRHTLHDEQSFPRQRFCIDDRSFLRNWCWPALGSALKGGRGLLMTRVPAIEFLPQLKDNGESFEAPIKILKKLAKAKRFGKNKTIDEVKETVEVLAQMLEDDLMTHVPAIEFLPQLKDNGKIQEQMFYKVKETVEVLAQMLEDDLMTHVPAIEFLPQLKDNGKVQEQMFYNPLQGG
ncbi:hypothetical protein DM02DRAFT_650516 [Periconia macrospinosa]|uniref:Tudor domain-containing protein n=1 Tax=Periconia macrospinosa TaxID=97972 RepID=A0A2V1E5V4_9PLEO|nr:hypothetical protein DM02DRAFT_650516 [Periconia macrospinosa]